MSADDPERRDDGEATDAALVDAYRAGDPRAMRTLLRRYERRVYAQAFGILRNREDALDVAQEAFLRVHRNLDGFSGQSSFYTWLYRIVANLCIDRIRRSKRHRDVEFDDGLSHDEAGAGVGTDLQLGRFGDPERQIRRREIAEAVNESLDALTDKHRAVLMMREGQGMSYAEMAEAVGCSRGTIMSRLFHARRNMQRLLSDRLGDMAPPIVGGSEESEADDVKGRSRPRTKVAPP